MINTINIREQIPFQLDVLRCWFGITGLDDWIYIAGGENYVERGVTDSVQRLNVFNGKIENLAALTAQNIDVRCFMIRCDSNGLPTK